MPRGEGTVILLVAPDDALRYLMERYSHRAGCELRAAGPEDPWPDGAAVIWVASIDVLDALRPRERALVGDDTPVIVFATPEDEQRVRALGADHRVTHPLTYAGFVNALAAVGATLGATL
jgi:CheY-like chemotaxis protein